MVIRIIVFLFLNFAALGVGGFFSGSGASSQWYQQLNQAPWTPPGWAFGTAWTTIMICFAIYMSNAWKVETSKQALVILYSVQWLLNASWSPVFFRYHQISFGLVIIVLLTLLVAFVLFAYRSRIKGGTVFILPYFLWLLVATSLNAYIWIAN